jgi:hypothetical protein
LPLTITLHPFTKICIILRTSHFIH